MRLSEKIIRTKNIKRLISLLVIQSMCMPTSIAYAYDSTKGYYDTYIKNGQLGGYQFTVEAHETPSNVVLPIIDKSYFPVTTEIYSTEVDNTAPSATYAARKVVKADIIFAIGETDQAGTIQSQIPNFTAQMASAGNNLDVNVKQVETQTIDMASFGAENIFNSWRKMPEGDGFGNLIWKLDKNEGKIYAEGIRRASTGGHRSVSIIDDSLSGFRTEDLTLSFSYNARGPEGEPTYHNVSASGYSNHTSGCVFRYNEDPVTKQWSCYMLAMGDANHTGFRGNLTDILGISLVKVRGGNSDWYPGRYGGTLPLNWDIGVKDYTGALTIPHSRGIDYPIGTWRHGEGPGRGPVPQMVCAMGSRAVVNTKSTDITIDCTGSRIKVYVGGILQLDVVDTYEEPYLDGTYGFFSFSSPNIYFSNVQITRGAEMSLGKSIQDVSWRDDSIRFIIHTTDIVPIDFVDPNSADYLYTLAKLMDSKSYLINLGKLSNKAELDRMVANLTTADGIVKGTFIRSDDPNILEGLNEAGDFIIELLREKVKPVEYVLVGDKVIWNTQYRDLEKDVPLNFGLNKDDGDIVTSWGIGTSLMNRYTEDSMLAEKWRFRHFPKFYDNDNGIVTYHNVWLNEPETVFNNVGKYRINYKRKDNPFAPNFTTTHLFDEYRKWSTDYDPIDVYG